MRFLSWGLKDLLEQKQITFNMTIDDMTNKLLASHHVVGDKQRLMQTLGGVSIFKLQPTLVAIMVMNMN